MSRTLDADARTAPAYDVARHPAPVDLDLDANEGPAWLAAALTRERPRPRPATLQRYLRPQRAEAELARRLGCDPDRVLLTCGGDDALARVARVWLARGRELVLPCPTFEMLERNARAREAETVVVPWPGGAFPVDRVLARVGPRTSLIAVVSPNNPTGAVATAADVARLHAGRQGARLLLDLAYTEFADDDLQTAVAGLDGVLVVRTFSKAHGLAGLRVGYVLGDPDDIAKLRAAGLPYPVGGQAWDLARASLDAPAARRERYVRRVRDERVELARLLRAAGADVPHSQANFVLARTRRARWWRDGLAGLGIGVRLLEQRTELASAVRVSCPGRPVAQRRLTTALRTLTEPQALLFDMDGVLADVSRSYRRAILETAAAFGVELVPAQIAAAKAAGDANNDWVLTRRLLHDAGVDVPLDAVIAAFERRYQGTNCAPGLRRFERPLVSRGLLERLRARVPLGIVTGRPRADAQTFLARFGLESCFASVVCLEDGPPKPHPGPVRRALADLGVSRAWLVGDTPDDVHAARGAGVLPLGVIAPGEDAADGERTLLASGAARVLGRLDTLLELLP